VSYLGKQTIENSTKFNRDEGGENVVFPCFGARVVYIALFVIFESSRFWKTYRDDLPVVLVAYMCGSGDITEDFY
jgi:hypothetical protein